MSDAAKRPTRNLSKSRAGTKGAAVSPWRNFRLRGSVTTGVKSAPVKVSDAQPPAWKARAEVYAHEPIRALRNAP